MRCLQNPDISNTPYLTRIQIELLDVLWIVHIDFEQLIALLRQNVKVGGRGIKYEFDGFYIQRTNLLHFLAFFFFFTYLILDNGPTAVHGHVDATPINMIQAHRDGILDLLFVYFSVDDAVKCDPMDVVLMRAHRLVIDLAQHVDAALIRLGQMNGLDVTVEFETRYYCFRGQI